MILSIIEILYLNNNYVVYLNFRIKYLSARYSFSFLYNYYPCTLQVIGIYYKTVSNQKSNIVCNCSLLFVLTVFLYYDYIIVSPIVDGSNYTISGHLSCTK